MFLRLLPLLALALSGKIMASAYPVEIFEYVDDIKVVAFIRDTDIDKASKWTPFESAPPLTISGALEGIRNYIESNAEYKDTALTSIELKQIPGHKDFWHYLIRVESHSADKPQFHYFVMLLNGKVIPAVREPEAYK